MHIITGIQAYPHLDAVSPALVGESRLRLFPPPKSKTEAPICWNSCGILETNRSTGRTRGTDHKPKKSKDPYAGYAEIRQGAHAETFLTNSDAAHDDTGRSLAVFSTFSAMLHCLYSASASKSSINSPRISLTLHGSGDQLHGSVPPTNPSLEVPPNSIRLRCSFAR